MSETPGTETPATCMRCGRVLTNKYSIRRGYGRGCQAKLRAAAEQVTKIYTRTQVGKAATALRSGTIHWIGSGEHSGIYECQSSNGTDVYVTTCFTCTCPSRVRCYHQCAVMIRELTPVHRH